MSARTDGFTIVGGAGFVGSQLASLLKSRGQSYRLPVKGDLAALTGNLGHLVYCAGTTSDFRTRPHDTIDAHVSLINYILKKCDFRSLTYLSSTRIYRHSASTAEVSPIVVAPEDSEDLFNLSKLTGEAICRQSGRENVRAVRLSNVIGPNFGSNDFIFSVIRDAIKNRKVLLKTSGNSEKDYIHYLDAVELIARIARDGILPLYNVAAGQNLTNSEILGEICEATSASLHFASDCRVIRFSPIDVGRIRSEFDFRPRPVLPLIRELTAEMLEINQAATDPEQQSAAAVPPNKSKSI